jgi:hypothetical protein
VELQAPQDLQRAMALARAYEQRVSALAAAASAGRPPRPPTRFHHQPGSMSSSTPTTPQFQHSASSPSTTPTPVSTSYKTPTTTSSQWSSTAPASARSRIQSQTGCLARPHPVGRNAAIRSNMGARRPISPDLPYVPARGRAVRRGGGGGRCCVLAKGERVKREPEPRHEEIMGERRWRVCSVVF